MSHAPWADDDGRLKGFRERLSRIDPRLRVRWNPHVDRWCVLMTLPWGEEYPVWNAERPDGSYHPLNDEVIAWLCDHDSGRDRHWLRAYQQGLLEREQLRKDGDSALHLEMAKYHARGVKREFDGLSDHGAVIPKTREINRGKKQATAKA
jgi:hypothetical protein